MTNHFPIYGCSSRASHSVILIAVLNHDGRESGVRQIVVDGSLQSEAAEPGAVVKDYIVKATPGKHIVKVIM